MKKAETKIQTNTKGGKSFIAQKSDSGFLGVQAKLKVGKPDDKYEKEADRVADTVMRKKSAEKSFFTPSPASGVQTKPIAQGITPLVQLAEEEEAQTKLVVQKEEEEEAAQPKLEIQCEEEEEMAQTQPMEEEEGMIQPKGVQRAVRSESINSQILQKSKGNGSAMENGVKAEMEHGFGADFSGVKVHTNRQAIQMNKSLGAQAFTTGNDIFFNEGKYTPGSEKGKRLLAHELTHTLQQGASAAVNVQREVAVNSSNNNKTLEETNECKDEVEKEKAKFLQKWKYGPISTSLEYGGFQSEYYPLFEYLAVNVRGKTKFKNGLSLQASDVIKSEDSDLDNLAVLLNTMNDKTLNRKIVNTYYTWSDDQKEKAKNNFKQRLKETTKIWEAGGKMRFHVDEPCWEDIKAKVGITIDVQDAGTATFDETKASTTDHIQVALVKNPNKTEKGQIKSDIKAAAQKSGTNYSKPELSVTANVAPSNVMTLTNTDLTEFSNFSNDFQHSNLRVDINFGHGKYKLTTKAKKRIDAVLKIYKSGDNNPINNKVTLVGYASKSGSSEYNTNLVDKRLDSVYNFLTKKRKFTNIESRKKQKNYSDKLAEKNPSLDSSMFRKVQIVIGSGEKQNVVAHEFGHVFKLEDEYVTPNGTPGSGKPRGELVGHNEMAENIGAGGIMGNRFIQILPEFMKSAIRNLTGEGVRAEYSDNIMSLGNEVRKQHYGPFGKALNKLTGKRWRIFNKK